MVSDRIKALLVGLWDFLVIIAYMKFYFMCFMGIMLSLLCSIWIINDAGQDITQIAEGVRWVGYFGLTYLAIIMADKLKELFQRGKKG